MGALPGVIAALAHGGLAGAIVEALIALAVGGGLVAIWLRERRARARASSDEAKLTDDEA